MTTRRGRGRRDNGLDAALWSPLRDVDPRIGEHLLDLLQAAGIAAYLEPSADVEPYTRTVSLPSPPSDRLFVDRARRAEARSVIEEHAPSVADASTAPAPEPAAARPELDEDAEWARIVAAFEAESGRAVVQGEPADAPPPPPHELPVLDRPDEHYEPPPPPPIPAPAPASLYAVILIVAGILLIGAPGILRLSADLGLVLGVAGIAGGAAMLVSRMRDRSDDDGDDGAVV
ncbi:MAG: putative membrane protein [uncultured Blastococcus sp.]|uniref:Putative membrane protein n=1 Tax=uncultured Blastococcus sp. TaxID=217144 RepID=A0A6J4J7M6_9ACTN|nr:MAG: putative membrane protein [uncultured Blastococcus sp.]